MRRAARSSSAVAPTALLLMGSLPAFSQLSPGPLSSPHAELEGSARCAACHAPQKGVDPDACLECHTALGDRVKSGLGLHSGPAYEACHRCHVEHQGRDFELVWWGDEGRSAFDHRTAGFGLTGRHESLACQECHRPERLTDPERLRAGRARLQTTYLGLGTTCRECHDDRHRGQFADQTCHACHDDMAWRPAPGFDHGAAAFPLEGRHTEVACGDCHPPVELLGAITTRYRGVPDDCLGCHRDPHEGRLGPGCDSCHGVTSWQSVDRASFDHQRTRYPLTGRHARVPCAGCHEGDQTWTNSGVDRCSACHGDPHLGQLAGDGDPGCRSCHATSGFRPAAFGAREHARSDFPLLGAHLAVPCDRCHATGAADDLPAPYAPWSTSGAARGRPVARFRFATTACSGCHLDPHEGRLDRYAVVDGCASCHRLESWREVAFDHDLSRFALTGRHVSVACDACHRREVDEDASRLSGIQSSCSSCHLDAHAGQLASNGVTDCARCHDPEGWTPAVLDHQRTRFPLDGAHRRVACAACHPSRPVDGRETVIYRPLGTACPDCHRGGGVDG